MRSFIEILGGELVILGNAGGARRGGGISYIEILRVEWVIKEEETSIKTMTDPLGQ